ncbi:hypothetical protein [Micromonospora wenchangensis]|uniref:hypothetical protein n=1 Tax=Micromonospora wenchangensis TaxID=1185415 RepID=UPI003448DEEF
MAQVPAHLGAAVRAPLPKAGDLVDVGRAASVQFVRPIRCRVIRVLDWITYDGWCWLDVYQLDAKGDAVLRRSIFVRPAGLVTVHGARPVRRPPADRLAVSGVRRRSAGRRADGVWPAAGDGSQGVVVAAK